MKWTNVLSNIAGGILWEPLFATDVSRVVYRHVASACNWWMHKISDPNLKSLCLLLYLIVLTPPISIFFNLICLINLYIYIQLKSWTILFILFYFNNSIVGGRRFEPWLEILKSTNWLNYRTLGWTIHSWLRSFCTSQARSQFIFYMLMGIVFC